MVHKPDIRLVIDNVSLQLLADPAYLGKISVPDAASSAYALAALATGISNYTNMTDAEFETTSNFLRSIHPNVRFYWSDGGQFDQAMASGEIEMGWAWNQSELNLIWNETPAIMVKDTDKGIATWVCGYVHLKSATTPEDQVYDMLNALSDVGSGQYIIKTGDTHIPMQRPMTWSTEKRWRHTALMTCRSSLKAACFLMQLNPHWNPKCCVNLNESNPVSKPDLCAGALAVPATT